MKRHLKIVLGALVMTAAWHASAQVRLYQDDNFAGRSVAVDRDVRDLSRFDFNDVTSSVVVRGGRWTLCSEARFRGRCVTLRPGRYASLRDMGLNDKVSSVRQGGGNGQGGGDDPRR